jgi:hypothetical protein
MPLTARCKFVVESVTLHAYGSRSMKLSARYDEPLSKEDRAFNTATPGGEMTLQINNPAVFDTFVPGKHVYIDVIPIEE